MFVHSKLFVSGYHKIYADYAQDIFFEIEIK